MANQQKIKRLQNTLFKPINLTPPESLHIHNFNRVAVGFDKKVKLRKMRNK